MYKIVHRLIPFFVHFSIDIYNYNKQNIRESVVKIRMLEYYIKISLGKKIINYKKYENLGKHLLEINKMINI